MYKKASKKAAGLPARLITYRPSPQHPSRTTKHHAKKNSAIVTFGRKHIRHISADSGIGGRCYFSSAILWRFVQLIQA